MTVSFTDGVMMTAAVKSRAERKAQTRARILDAAWTLVAEGRGLDSLGLREVARAAELAAPSLYNHFADMDSLGLALLDQACFRLRRWMGEGRRQLIQAGTAEAIPVLVRRFLDYLEHHEAEFRLLVQQRIGSHPVFRRRIHHELSLAVTELGEDIQLVGGGAADAWLEAEAAAAILLGFGIQSLDVGGVSRRRREKRLVAQLEMVVLGARRQLAVAINK